MNNFTDGASRRVSTANTIQDIELNYSREGDKTFFLLNKYVPTLHDEIPTMISTEVIGFEFGRVTFDDLDLSFKQFKEYGHENCTFLQFLKTTRGLKCEY